MVKQLFAKLFLRTMQNLFLEGANGGLESPAYSTNDWITAV